MFSTQQWTVFRAICDAVVEPLSYAELDRINPEAPQQEKRQLAGTGGGQGENFQKAIAEVLRDAPASKARLFSLVLNALSYRVSAAPLTKSYKLITEMNLHERGMVIRSWQDSPITALNMLASQMVALGMFGFYLGNPYAMAASGFKLDNPIFNKISQGPLFVPKFVEFLDGTEHFDVVVIGSGCGGGIAAYEAASAGFKVLIVEKGRYISPQNVPKDPRLAEQDALEQSGALATDDGTMAILAGSTVGGGGAVNWSCSLRTPQPIREEWSEDAPFYKTTRYDDALDFVCEKMGVTTDFGAKHSFTNQLILDSCAKLDYPAKVAPQNTGKHPHNNRYHGYGYRSGAKGGIAVWLEGATQNGAVMAAGVGARRIVHKGGKVLGVELDTNGKTTFIKAGRVVSSSGSLNTPVLLQRSGFKNGNIGKNLKLHPATSVYGDFDQVVNLNEDPIMTTVSTVAENLDGHYHGVKIEAMHHNPHLLAKLLPWKGGKQYAGELVRSSHMGALVVITRDVGDGRVYFDKSAPMAPQVSYTTNKYDLWSLKEGCVAGANMLYIGGARRIIMPDGRIPEFVASRPKEGRRLRDEDYQEWLQKVKKHTFHNYDVAIATAHQMGSCRISAKGSRHGALDVRGRLYENKHVHVIDASVFPSASGVNPMISTLATGKILAEELVRCLRADATKL